MKFSEMSVSDRTIAALNEMGYNEATEVQEKSIPAIIAGKNIIVRSQTGTGKTAAFGIGLMELLSANSRSKALILAPTRELIVQITKELRSIAKNHRMRIYAIYGGQDINAQIKLLQRGFEIIAATPGRLLDHIERGTVDLADVNCIVLDEADRMLDMGFKDDINSILEQVNAKRQMMLFSATIDRQILTIAENYMGDHDIIEAGAEGKVETIEEEFIHMTRAEKIGKLKNILALEPMGRTIVFVATKRAAEYVCHKLSDDGANARYLHGGKSQNQRERTLREFKEGNFNILIATDVAARGLHIDGLTHIVNYDKASSDEMHTHRIGRTGRMGKEGKAITFIETDPIERPDYRNMRRGGYGRPRQGGYNRYGRSNSREEGGERRSRPPSHRNRYGGFVPTNRNRQHGNKEQSSS